MRVPLKIVLAALALLGANLRAQSSNTSVAGGSSGDFLLLGPTGNLFAAGNVPNDPTIRVSVSADGTLVAASASTGELQLWNSSGQSLLSTTLAGHDPSLPLPVVTRGGITVAGASGGAYVLYGPAGQLRAMGMIPSVPSVGLTVDTDGSLVGIGSSTGSLVFLDAAGTVLSNPMPLSNDPSAPLALAVGTNALVASTTGEYRIFGPAGTTLTQGFVPVPPSNTVALSVSAAAGFGAIGTPAGVVRLVNGLALIAPPGLPVSNSATVPLAVATMTSGASAISAIGGSNGELRFYQHSTGNTLGSPPLLSNNPLVPLAIDATAGFLLVGSTAGEIRAFDATGAQTFFATLPNDPNARPAVATDGTFACALLTTGPVAAWNVSTGSIVAFPPTLPGGGLISGSIDLAGGRVAAGGPAGNFLLHRLQPAQTLVPPTTIASPPARPLSVATDVNRTVVAGIRGDVRLYVAGTVIASPTIPATGLLPLSVDTEDAVTVYGSSLGAFTIRGLTPAPISSGVPNPASFPLVVDTDDRWVVVLGGRGDFLLYDTTGTVVQTAVVPNSVFVPVADTDDGFTLLTGDSGVYVLFDPQGQPIAAGTLPNAPLAGPLPGDTDDGWSVLATPQGDVRVIAPDGSTVADLVLPGAGTPAIDTDAAVTVAVRADASGAPAGVLLLHGANAVTPPSLATATNAPGVPLTVDTDAEIVAVGGSNGGFVLFSGVTGALLATGSVANDPTRPLVLDTDGGVTVVAGTSAAGTQVVILGADGSTLTTFTSGPGGPLSVDTEGRMSFVGSAVGAVALYADGVPLPLPVVPLANDPNLALSLDTDPGNAVQAFGVTPNVGPPTGGTSVTITGVGFSALANTTATVGGAPLAGITFAGETILRGTTAPVSASGFVNVAVTKGASQSLLTGAFLLAHAPAPFGNGCPGSFGVPTLAVPGGLPYLGNASFALSVQTLPAFAPTTLFVGSSNTTFLTGIPLPIPLGGLGLPGCEFLTSADAIFVLSANAAGVASLPLPLPVAPALLGASAYVQALILDAGAPNIPGISMTAGTAVTF